MPPARWNNDELRVLAAERRDTSEDLALYDLRRGIHVPNPHTPWLWTQANLTIALESMKAVHGCVHVRHDVRRPLAPALRKRVALTIAGGADRG